MNRKNIIILVALLIESNYLCAFDFSAVCSTGQTLYYLKTSDSTVIVTHPGNIPYGTSYRIFDYSGMCSQQLTTCNCPYVSATYSGIAYGADRYVYPVIRYPIPSGILIIPETVSNNDTLFVVDEIDDAAFANCEITTITIPSTIKSIGYYAFTGNPIDTIIFNATDCMQMDSRFVFQECNDIQSFIIGEGVNRIPDYAFYSLWHLFDTLPLLSRFNYIGAWSFPHRTDILSIPNSINGFGDSAFYDCDNLLTINTSAQIIGSGAFANCDSLLTANIYSRSICSSAFANCDRLVSVTLGDSVETLGSGAFSGCFRLNNITLGNGISSIGDRAFSGCIRLTNPELPNSLVTIGSRAFDGCGDINGKLTFPASITHIGDSAYNGVGNITEIEMKGSTPPTIHAHTFAAVDSLVTVSVPCEAILNYYITDYWENFPNIVEAPPYRLTVQSNNEVMGTATVTQQTTCSNHTATIYAVA